VEGMMLPRAFLDDDFVDLRLRPVIRTTPVVVAANNEEEAAATVLLLEEPNKNLPLSFNNTNCGLPFRYAILY
jgi:hypothetical protein